jgi:hypothetical protein
LKENGISFPPFVVSDSMCNGTSASFTEKL